MSLPDDLIQTINQFRQSMAAHVPALQSEVNSIISRKEKDYQPIEKMLDTLLSLTTTGFCDDLFIKLLEYYKTVNSEAAADYWRFYEDMND